MAKYIGQIRWFGPDNADNYPANLSMSQLRYGTAFPKTYPITKFSVQTIPGTKIYLNSSVHPLIVGHSGVFELDVEGFTKISSICFDNVSLEAISMQPSAYIIIDYEYERE